MKKNKTTTTKKLASKASKRGAVLRHSPLEKTFLVF